MANRNINGDVNVEFNEASSRQGLDSGESVKTLFGKIRKWLSDLKAVAFTGSYNDLTNKPSIPPAVAVKGNAETAYRTGNVNLTAANIGLGNVNNTSDLNKPISTATQAALDSQQAQLDKALEQTGYNLVKITATTQTINGVTFTVDKSAGTITANGTANQLTFFAFKLQINDGKYILSGCPPTGSDFTYRIDIRNSIGGISFTNAIDYGAGTSAITLSGDKYLNIRIVNGYNCSNLVFKPMIVPAELAGVPFQPYAKSNAELTQDMDDISGELDCLLIQAALVNNEVIIQNTSDFTDELYGKYFSYTKPKFAILKLQRTSNTYCYKALLNSSSVGQGNSMDASFITVGGTYMGIYRFGWSHSGTVGTPVVSYTSLNIGS